MAWAKRVMGIISYDLERWRQSGSLWRMGGIHVALCVTIILITWPGTQKITSLSPANIMKPYLLTELLILSYYGLMLGSETFPRHDAGKTSPYDWVIHQVASVNQVIVAKFAGIGLVMVFMIVTTLPINVLAVLSAGPARANWHLGWSVVVLETTCLVSIGTMIRVMQGRKRKRSVAAEAIFVVGLALAIIWVVYGSGHFLAVFNPIMVITRLTDPLSAGGASHLALYFISRAFLFASTLIATYVFFQNETIVTSQKGVTV